jgi:hypothetical protein
MPGKRLRAGCIPANTHQARRADDPVCVRHGFCRQVPPGMQPGGTAPNPNPDLIIDRDQD